METAYLGSKRNAANPEDSVCVLGELHSVKKVESLLEKGDLRWSESALKQLKKKLKKLGED